VGVLRTSCPASPSGEHHWTAWRKPVLLPDAEWTCGRCGAEISAPPDPSGCAPEWSWIQLEQLLAGGVEEAA
jgi:hypothetical protein